MIGDTLVASTDAGAILALDAETGAERWRHELAPEASVDSQVSSDSDRPERPETLTTDGSRVYVTTGTTLVAIVMADRMPCWRAQSFEGGYASGSLSGLARCTLPLLAMRISRVSTLQPVTASRRSPASRPNTSSLAESRRQWPLSRGEERHRAIQLAPVGRLAQRGTSSPSRCPRPRSPSRHRVG